MATPEPADYPISYPRGSTSLRATGWLPSAAEPPGDWHRRETLQEPPARRAPTLP